jgi:N utilization substance protein B
MGRRHSARRAALQYHFWHDLHSGDGPETIQDFWEMCPAKASVQQFAQPLIEGMLTHLPEIDERIRRYCVVSINEAIELAREFGGPDSWRFVNGILDRVKDDLSRPLREPLSKSTSG